MADQGFFTNQTREEQWRDYLAQQQAISPGLEVFRRGSDALRTPLESWRQFNPPVAVPHPNHADYSSIEVAKRRKAAAEEAHKKKQQQITHIRIHGVEQRAPWLPPDQYLPFQRGIPNIKNFSKPLRLRMPRLY